MIALIFHLGKPEPRPSDGRWEGGTPAPGTGLFGIGLFLVSLTMLFGASIIGYLVIRSQTPDWPPAGMPGLNPWVIASTILILLSSATMHLAQSGIRAGFPEKLQRWISATILLGSVFLAVQLYNWWQMLVPGMDVRMRNLFIFLTALHALHVVGGLAPMAVLWRRSMVGHYTASAHWGVTYCAIYWHFLAAVWIALFGTLYLLG